jgi:hypothetical protein
VFFSALNRVIGRHLFDITNGWEESPPAAEHVIVVSHRPRPDGWNSRRSNAVHPRPQASYYFTDDVAQVIAKARELAGTATSPWRRATSAGRHSLSA